jgi:hypothetical protein
MNIIRFMILGAVILMTLWLGLSLGHMMANRQQQIERQIEQTYDY